MARWKPALTRSLLFAVLAIVLLHLIVSISGACVCVPEELCPAPEVDLRLVDTDEECQPGAVCCDVSMGTLTMGNVPKSQPFCATACVLSEDQCSGDYLDNEYGEGLLDVRLMSDEKCPGDYICCKSVEPSIQAVCNGTCVPGGMCTMFESSGTVGCTGGQVCCRMNRNMWTGLINEINAIDHAESAVKQPETHCEGAGGADGSPAWFVSVWARVEVLQGFLSHRFLCGGVLVSPKIVLTLASCVERTTSSNLYVILGSNYDLVNRFSIRDDDTYTIDKLILHEDYDPATETAPNNAALLRLSEAASPQGGEECFARFTTEGEPLGECYVFGWNKDAYVQGSESLLRSYPTKFNVNGCNPGTVCFEPGANCEDRSMQGSAVVCGDRRQRATKLHALLVNNCTGLAVDHLSAWLRHQENPTFMQMPQRPVPSRQYLPV
ncbi:uncharacterized protein LOC128278372 [Anopheles cruzii]|uniref:uncharacterized protein LOC128278372 n=1 Tax=Anopheles cruzii TaxID=68878 RepID=UPI0022EC7662|nr:uncharacterized protein LOC128278372 [Anopheles cruzii]